MEIIGLWAGGAEVLGGRLGAASLPGFMISVQTCVSVLRDERTLRTSNASPVARRNRLCWLATALCTKTSLRQGLLG